MIQGHKHNYVYHILSQECYLAYFQSLLALVAGASYENSLSACSVEAMTIDPSHILHL